MTSQAQSVPALSVVVKVTGGMMNLEVGSMPQVTQRDDDPSSDFSEAVSKLLKRTGPIGPVVVVMFWDPAQ